MADLCVPSNIGCEEREKKEKTSQHNKGRSLSRQQETQESVLRQKKENYFSRSQSCKQFKRKLFIKPRQS